LNKNIFLKSKNKSKKQKKEIENLSGHISNLTADIETLSDDLEKEKEFLRLQKLGLGGDQQHRITQITHQLNQLGYTSKKFFEKFMNQLVDHWIWLGNSQCMEELIEFANVENLQSFFPDIVMDKQIYLTLLGTGTERTVKKKETVLKNKLQALQEFFKDKNIFSPLYQVATNTGLTFKSIHTLSSWEPATNLSTHPLYKRLQIHKEQKKEMEKKLEELKVFYGQIRLRLQTIYKVTKILQFDKDSLPKTLSKLYKECKTTFPEL